MMKFINWLIKPFKNDLSYLCLLFLLISIIDIYNLINNHFISYAVYLGFHCYITAYFLCLIGQNLPRKGYSIYKKILLLIAIISFIIDSFCHLIYGTRFSQDFAIIIMQSNFAEMKEFIESYISMKHISFIFIILIIFISIYYIIKRLSVYWGRKTHYIALIGVIIGAILTIRNPLIYNDVFIGKIIRIFQVPNVPNLHQFLSYPNIVSLKTRKPQNIVMIIGESFSKSHSSLYGYSLETNPYMQTLLTDSNLFVYSNIKSPATHTIPSFQAIMSSYKPEYQNNILWYQCTTLPEVLHHSGYYTYWISNQCKVGLFDTIIGKYADLCNHIFYVGDKFAGLNHTNLDEEVIPLLNPLLQESKDNKFYFIHLMGSHSVFNKRYPKSFEKFKAENYLFYPQHQRENLASYDNSILYNDSVVYEIMNLFHDKEAIVFYFSDHAIDVYESTDNYIGHARTTDSLSVEAGSKIPFMIYTSPLYQQNFPNEMEQIKKSTLQNFRTDDMIYTIMDIIGVTFEGENLEGKSLFQLSK